MDRIIECYVATSYVALEAINCTDPVSWHQLHTLLPNLREYISCRLCHKLVDHLNPYVEGFACSECMNYQTTEDTIFTIIQCYKKLCALINKSPIYDIMCSRHEDIVLVKLITEAIGIPCPINGHIGLLNGSVPLPLQLSGIVVKQGTKEVNNHNNIESNLSLDIKLPIENKTSNEYIMPQIIDVQSLKHKSKNQSAFNTVNNYSKKKKNERRGCRCGNATTTPGKLTCFGQRCPCYTEQRPCDRCKCRGCRNPRQKQSNNDGNPESDQIRRKPVTLELVSSLQPSNIIDSKPTFGSYPGSYIVRDVNVMQFPSHSRNCEQGGTEVTLGHVNSMFRSS